mgnify:CR=1 FL=1
MKEDTNKMKHLKNFIIQRKYNHSEKMQYSEKYELHKLWIIIWRKGKSEKINVKITNKKIPDKQLGAQSTNIYCIYSS